MFDFDDPTKSAEDKMSDALLDGCLLAGAAALVIIGIVATIVKVWI